jgi:hypothetical protein
MAKKEPVPNLYTAAGNVNHPYRSLGIVIAIVSRQESGCGGGLPVGQALSGGGLPVGQALLDATDDLKRQAAERSANGLIHISYMHRVSTSPGCGGARSNFEVYAWGTAVRL